MNNYEGYWGSKPTATIDWCEANYEITQYIVEFWNTISCLIMIILPIYGIMWSFKVNLNYKKLKRYNKNLDLTLISDRNLIGIPNSLIICNIALLVVGIGSWLFHMTLQYSMQLLDEIPMLWACSTLIYANADLIINLTYKKPAERTLIRRMVFVLDMFYIVLVTYIYVYHLKNPVFHEVCFAIQIGVIVAENAMLVKKLNLSTRLYFLGASCFAIGFLLWNIDNYFCSYLKLYRFKLDYFINYDNSNKNIFGKLLSVVINMVFILLKSLSELHAVWHLFTGYGSYMAIIAVYDAFFENNFKKILQTRVDTKPKTGSKATKVINSRLFGLINNLNYDYISVQMDKFK